MLAVAYFAEHESSFIFETEKWITKPSFGWEFIPWTQESAEVGLPTQISIILMYRTKNESNTELLTYSAGKTKFIKNTKHADTIKV